jgi:hypothetical protein
MILLKLVISYIEFTNSSKLDNFLDKNEDLNNICLKKEVMDLFLTDNKIVNNKIVEKSNTIKDSSL